tara:strand:+ start:638 stop:934 length:297 start_codon:yes stop_codon:yes gene_type:complete
MNLFDYAASARRSDPATSQAAATANKPQRRGHREILLEAIERLGGCTAREAFVASDLPPRCCYWKRVSELLELEIIKVVGTRVDPETGSPCQIYKVRR